MLGRAAPRKTAMAEEAAVFGIEGVALDSLLGTCADPELYELHEDVAEVFFLFQQCQGSWNLSPTGGLIGLNKSDVVAVAGAMGIRLGAERMTELTICETAFIKEFNKRQKKGPKKRGG